jgi:hypothetical protein
MIRERRSSGERWSRGGALASAGVGVALLVACATREASTAAVTAAQDVVCDPSPVAGVWQCGEDRIVECVDPSGTTLEPIHVPPVAAGDAGPPACAEATFGATPAGPLPPGTYEVTVTQSTDAGIVEACRSTVTIRDTVPPIAKAKEAALWPPNHAMHRVTIADCVEVTDACDANVSVRFTSVSSDEPVDARGDGHHAPDVVADGCDAVALRSERQGGGDGRVYRLGWRAADHAGNAVEGECRVVVAHDQSGRPAIDSGEAYRVAICP